MLNLWTLGIAEAVVAGLAVYNAYSKHRQFFPTCVYLLKSSLSVVALVSFALYAMLLLCYGLKNILFGELRLIETEHLQEYGWLAVSESFLAMTIFRDEFDGRFIIAFTGILFVKAFHWVTRDRVDYMEQTARLPHFFNARMIACLYLLLFIDVYGVFKCVAHVRHHGPSMAILFASEFSLLFVSLLSMGTRYILNALDLHRGGPWEHRSTFLFYFDFVVAFFGVVVYYYGIPLHIIRDLYLTFRSFIIRIQDIVRYRRATMNMEQRYPDVTEEELARTDRICIICREEMVSAKKLPCGHLFHFRCLRSWLERQQACPTCRRSILDPEEPATPVNPQPRPEGQQQPRSPAAPTEAMTSTESLQPSTHPGQMPILVVPPGQIAFLAPAERDENRDPSGNDTASTSATSQPVYDPDSGQSPIYLEPIDEMEATRFAPQIRADYLSAEQGQDVKERTLGHIRREVEILTRLQMQISSLTEHLTMAQSQLEHVENAEEGKCLDPDAYSPSLCSLAAKLLQDARQALKKANSDDPGKEKV